MFRSYAWIAYALAGLSASVYLLTHDALVLGTLTASATLIMFLATLVRAARTLHPHEHVILLNRGK